MRKRLVPGPRRPASRRHVILVSAGSVQIARHVKRAAWSRPGAGGVNAVAARERAFDRSGESLLFEKPRRGVAVGSGPAIADLGGQRRRRLWVRVAAAGAPPVRAFSRVRVAVHGRDPARRTLETGCRGPSIWTSWLRRCGPAPRTRFSARAVGGRPGGPQGTPTTARGAADRAPGRRIQPRANDRADRCLVAHRRPTAEPGVAHAPRCSLGDDDGRLTSVIAPETGGGRRHTRRDLAR